MSDLSAPLSKASRLRDQLEFQNTKIILFPTVQCMLWGKSESISVALKIFGALGMVARTPLLPALGRQRQDDLCGFKASTDYVHTVMPVLQMLRAWC